MTARQALQTFWESFSLPAFDATTVPDDTPLPYITYEAGEDYFDYNLASSASLWYHSPSWVEITEKEKQIADYIGRGGKIIEFDGGGIWIKRGEPWAQRMSDINDTMTRRMVLNIEIEYMQ